MASSLAIIFFICLDFIFAQQTLEQYNVSKNAISTSGISAGSCFGTQLHVAHSSVIMGFASVAGAPYYCAQGNLVDALNLCMGYPQDIDVSTLTSKTDELSQAERIDPTANLANHRVFIFHGTADETVMPPASTKMQEYYQRYGTSVQTNFNMNAGHGFPTMEKGVNCPDSDTPYINRCQYKGAYHFLNYIYSGNLTDPPTSQPINGQIIQFNQREFDTDEPDDSSWDVNGGYLYIPSGCVAKTKACRLHIAFHGCLQGREFVNDQFVRDAGYLEVAEVNDIIVLFPQLISNAIKVNPNGCYDWWAYEEGALGSEDKYVTKEGKQTTAVKKMIDRVAGL